MMQGTFLGGIHFRGKMVLHWFIIVYLEPFWTKKIGLSNSKKNKNNIWLLRNAERKSLENLKLLVFEHLV